MKRQIIDTILLNNFIPVSYTHLDVYKRQAQSIIIHAFASPQALNVAGNVNDSAQINIAQKPWNQIMYLVASDAASERLYTFKINGNVINTIKIVIAIPMCVSRISFLL